MIYGVFRVHSSKYHLYREGWLQTLCAPGREQKIDKHFFYLKGFFYTLGANICLRKREITCTVCTNIANK